MTLVHTRSVYTRTEVAHNQYKVRIAIPFSVYQITVPDGSPL